MKERIANFIKEWEKKRKNGYYTGTEDIVVLNTFADACKLFGYDFDLVRDGHNNLGIITVYELGDDDFPKDIESFEIS